MAAPVELHGALKPRMDSATRDSLLSAMLGIEATSADKDDTIMLCACAALYGVTLIMLVYAWCNYNYRPIRAKNLTWTTLIYVSTVLWFVGNICTNQHVALVGVWSKCKLWVIWFRVLFTFVFGSMTIVRFYALDRVFNQKKPFTTRSSLMAGAVVIILNVTFCLINQLLPSKKSIDYIDTIQACDITMAFRIAAVSFQWVLWISCGYLIFRLRNIQSSFNEFYESIAIFLVVIALLTETTITNLRYQYFVFEKKRRIEKTLVDTLAGTFVVWLFIGYPIFMSIFHRHEYEKRWLEKLAKDGPSNTYNASSNPNGTTAYAKMHDHGDSAFNNSQLNFDSNDMHSGYMGSHRPFDDPDPLNIESTLNTQAPYNDNLLPIALRNNIHIHKPILNTPTMFHSGYSDQSPDGRHVL